MEIYTNKVEETKKLAFTIGRLVNPPFFIALKGDLGAGKTAFTQGLAEGLETDPSLYVTSPTYNIVQIYPGDKQLVHCDLYRISDIDELELTGFFDAVEEPPSVAAIEWPERIEDDFEFDIIIDIKIMTGDKREISLISCGLKGLHLIEKLRSFR